MQTTFFSQLQLVNNFFMKKVTPPPPDKKLWSILKVFLIKMLKARCQPGLKIEIAKYFAFEINCSQSTVLSLSLSLSLSLKSKDYRYFPNSFPTVNLPNPLGTHQDQPIQIDHDQT